MVEVSYGFLIVSRFVIVVVVIDLDLVVAFFFSFLTALFFSSSLLLFFSSSLLLFFSSSLLLFFSSFSCFLLSLLLFFLFFLFSQKPDIELFGHRFGKGEEGLGVGRVLTYFFYRDSLDQLCWDPLQRMFFSFFLFILFLT